MNASTILDLVFLAFVLMFAIIGLTRGFIRELFTRGAPVLGLWGAILFFRRLNTVLEPIVKLHVLSLILSFLLIFIAVYIVVMIVRNIVSGIFRGEIFNGLDRLLGFVFGVAEGFALVALILILLNAQPWFDFTELLDGSYFYRMLKWAVVSVPAITGEIQEAVQSSGEAA